MSNGIESTLDDPSDDLRAEKLNDVSGAAISPPRPNAGIQPAPKWRHRCLAASGTIITFGDYQAFYECGTLFYQTSSNISWIGSVQSLIVFWLADRMGAINVVIPGSLLIGIVLLCNLTVHSAAGIICTAIFFGFLSGFFIATPPLLFMVLTVDKTKLGARMGVGYALLGLSVLPGGHGAGGVLQHDSRRLDWTAAWTYAGVLPLAACLVFCLLRIWRGGLKLMAKV
ncbi:hypothetical protein N7492_004629 [Penicillium capsulatum]|uniref:Major facilitator superfamily (MFS) profile domain-containing protein n=1 Tax=Penicillium capsulatum TaxID=69766 RepID=A0A9W9IAP0_9EURO|nr:hypothetical protein N7492_004629 [Penicillium capsulatum]KAJ6136256.1 hypothetical protein N7512_001416 [Penicillium capsulatum]